MCLQGSFLPVANKATSSAIRRIPHGPPKREPPLDHGPLRVPLLDFGLIVRQEVLAEAIVSGVRQGQPWFVGNVAGLRKGGQHPRDQEGALRRREVRGGAWCGACVALRETRLYSSVDRLGRKERQDSHPFA